MEKPNYRMLSPGIYLVRTQAGFMQAVNEVWSSNPDDCDVYGFPTEYPSVVTITVAYAGYHYVRCYSMHVNKMLDELQGE